MKMIDFFIPKGNEKELAKRATALGINEFVFLYSLNEYKKKKIDGFESGILIDANVKINDVLKAKQMSKFVVVKADDKLRSVIEKCSGIYVYGCEEQDGKDFIHFRNSGLNHILLNIANKKKVKFLFNFSDFLVLNERKKGIVLGRLKQNLMMFKKSDIEHLFVSFAKESCLIKKDYSALKRLVESNMVPEL